MPMQVVEIVCCKLTSLQQQLYERFIHSKNVSCCLPGCRLDADEHLTGKHRGLGPCLPRPSLKLL